MRLKLIGASLALVLISVFCVAVDSPRSGGPTAAVAQNDAQANAMRIEGEKRFHANCSRCHAAPPKFPPRMMATIVRHMRVRATITDEDMRLVLFFMTQ